VPLNFLSAVKELLYVVVMCSIPQMSAPAPPAAPPVVPPAPPAVPPAPPMVPPARPMVPPAPPMVPPARPMGPPAPPMVPPAPSMVPPARKKYTLAEVFGDDDDEEEESSEDVMAAGVGAVRQEYERPPLPGGWLLLHTRHLLLCTLLFDSFSYAHMQSGFLPWIGSGMRAVKLCSDKILQYFGAPG